MRARIVWSQEPSLTVPLVAVNRLGGQYFAFVAEDGEGGTVARQRSVDLGKVVGNDYLLRSGLEAGEHLGPHVGHDAGVDDDVGAVGDLHADLGEGRVERAHAEGDHIHGAAFHAAIKFLMHGIEHFPLFCPVIGGAHLIRTTRADKSAVLNTGNIPRG